MHKPAGFWIRGWAMLIDAFLLNVVALAAQLALFGIFYWISPALKIGAIGFQIWNMGFYILFSGFYYTILHARTGATLGKKIAKIKVIDIKTGEIPTLKKSFQRYLAYGISYLPIGGGFLMVAFQPKDSIRQALHELVTGTRSIRTS